MAIDRRSFIASGLALAAARPCVAAASRVEIIPDDTIGVVSPNIYGHFIEHLATVLKSGDMRAHNNFENTKAVEPSTTAVSGGGAQLVYAFAPASVTRLEFQIA